MWNGRGPVTPPPYSDRMNRAEILWAMTPDAPDVPLTIEELVGRPDWHQQAACQDSGVRSFFSDAPAHLEVASAVCAGCPVRQECHDTAMADPSLEGVWAGFTAKERREMRRSRVA
jgi:WhiB family transcriptional regulator, redox-sensing transcriptional regulator